MGLDLAREFQAPLFEVLASAAGPQARFPSLRTAAIDACAACDGGLATPRLGALLADAAEPANIRQHAAVALARINTDAARQQLLASLQSAPERLAVEIAAVLADSAAGGEALLASIESGKASPRLLQEIPVVARLRGRRLPRFEERLAMLTAALPPADARLRELIDRRRALVAGGHGDVLLGAAVFEKNCAACHRIGDKGAKIGPNLDGVGIRGLDRLLEDVLDPNRNVDQAFRTTQITTADGQILSGLALRDEGQVLVLADTQGKEIRVPASDIEQRVVHQLSLMPSNVPDLVSEAEFVHLMGYLLSQREATAPAASP
jgi:putative heme-binding domain-containing protein